MGEWIRLTVSRRSCIIIHRSRAKHAPGYVANSAFKSREYVLHCFTHTP
jgi:hypothetical protein